MRFGERVSIHDSDHEFEPVPISAEMRDASSSSPISIGDRVWIGANSVILRGASIGADSVIAAGSVVRGSIPPGVLAAGVPAKVIRPLLRDSTG